MMPRILERIHGWQPGAVCALAGILLAPWSGFSGDAPGPIEQAKQALAAVQENAPGITSRFLDISQGWPKAQSVPEPVWDNSVDFPSVQVENREKVLALIAEMEPKVIKEYETTTNAQLKAMDAWFLRECWQRGWLSAKAKGELVDRHFRAELYQVAAPHPSFSCLAELSFPFPATWTWFEPMLLVNGKTNGACGKAEHAMNVTRITLASQSGGALKNGDIIQYEIKLSQQESNRVVWERVIKSNPIRLDKLKEP